MFVPTTKQELSELNWDGLDVILVSGDAYLDISYDGTAIIAKYLINKGYKVGIISQPDINADSDILRLGVPKLFWGVSSGCVDSMVANYTSLNKKRRNDDLTPGGINNKRPDRAVIAYVNLIKKYSKDNKKPILIGGIESSLRRVAHYDYWSDSVRRSVLLDSKADALIYGMGEKSVLQFAEAIKNEQEISSIRGLCFLAKDKPTDAVELPSYEDVKSNKALFREMFKTFYENNDPINAERLCQKYDNRYLVQNPPQFYSSEDLDEIYNLDFERDAHPYYKAMGEIKALNTVKFSITTHRGCFGECNFCAIAAHQGRAVISRSEKSILKEVEDILENKNFKGVINDVGGATANMYGDSCPIQKKHGACKNKRCVFPTVCKNMEINHKRQIALLEKIRAYSKIKKAFIGSGLRYDLILADSKYGIKFLNDLAAHHVSGQLKIAPEHIDDSTLTLMGKPNNRQLTKFIEEFKKATLAAGKKQFLTYYFIAAHPGCDQKSHANLKNFINKEFEFSPEQIQVFTPTPSTYSTLYYYTEEDADSNKIFVEKSLKKKAEAKESLNKDANSKPKERFAKNEKNRNSRRHI
jgi:uncharacterized radical SAM protein YgiQ